MLLLAGAYVIGSYARAKKSDSLQEAVSYTHLDVYKRQASNIPPHNIKETIDAVVKMINNRIDENRDTEIEELMSVIQGPDFPTGATIIGRRGIEEAYRTGKGKIIVRAVTNIEPMQNGKNRIVVTEDVYKRQTIYRRQE